MADPDFGTTHKHNAGMLPSLDKLQTDTALLRRIAHNTDVIRLVLIWTLVVVPIVLIAIAVILGISAAATNTPAPSSSGAIACELVPANC